MTTPSPVSREEFHMLRQAVVENARRLDEIDRAGTRGVGALYVQITEVIKDVASVQTDLTAFRRDHQAQHGAELAARTSGRRWAIGTALVAMASLWAPLLYLIGHVR